MRMSIHQMVTHMLSKAEHPAYHTGLLVAGLVPSGFFPYVLDHNVAGTIYFMFLMPGAVISFIVSAVQIRRTMKKWFTKK